MRQVKGLAVLIVAGAVSAALGVPATSGASTSVGTRASTHQPTHGSKSGATPEASASPKVIQIPPATQPGEMGGGIETSSHTIEAKSKNPRVAIPKGWKSYTYGGVTISVPSSWAIKHSTNCPNISAPGSLLLGNAKTYVNCPDSLYTKGFVSIDSLSNLTSQATAGATTSTTTGQTPTAAPVGSVAKINGLSVDVAFGSPESQQWIIPSLGLQITGRGPGTDRVLHTLRRSRP
jgi:hypothetical protein